MCLSLTLLVMYRIPLCQMGKVLKLRQISSVPLFFLCHQLLILKINRICTLDCFPTNARSIVNKTSELEEYVFEYNPEVIIISDSWAQDSISDVELNLNGFNLLRSDRLFSKGGGCMLYVKELYKTIVDDLTDVPDSESVLCELTSTKSSLVIGVCYHSTSASVVNEVALHNVIGQACRRYTNVLICGDFNHRTIDWDLLQCNCEGQKVS